MDKKPFFFKKLCYTVYEVLKIILWHSVVPLQGKGACVSGCYLSGNVAFFYVKLVMPN